MTYNAWDHRNIHTGELRESTMEPTRDLDDDNEQKKFAKNKNNIKTNEDGVIPPNKWECVRIGLYFQLFDEVKSFQMYFVGQSLRTNENVR